jgi:hypothetical protein
MLLSLTTITLVQAVPPRAAAVAPVNPEPEIVMEVPPEVNPMLGDTEVISKWTYVYLFVPVIAPEGAVTTTLTKPVA